MEKLKDKLFKGTDSFKKGSVVKGVLTLRDQKTMELSSETETCNGYVLCIESNGVVTIVDPDSVELVN